MNGFQAKLFKLLKIDRILEIQLEIKLIVYNKIFKTQMVNQ